MANNSSITPRYLSSRSSVVTVNDTTRNVKFILFYGNHLDLPPGIWEVMGGAFSNGGSIDYIGVGYGTSNGNNIVTSIPSFSSADIEILANNVGYNDNVTPSAPFSSDYNNPSDVFTVEAPILIVSVKNTARIYVNAQFEATNSTLADCAVAIYAKRIG